MDNPQHYQPLSHALNPPVGATPHSKRGYTSSAMFSKDTVSTNNIREEEEEEDDEGLVEEQLSRADQDDQGSEPSSPGTHSASRKARRSSPTQDSEHKRRPGRPRGSKSSRPRASQTPTKTPFQHQGHPSLQLGSGPPQHPDVNTRNQQYYEFQWRVLNLCGEFYSAASELVKATPPLVLAQSYQMGPGSKVDPLVMLNDAKRICDTLLANPSRLIANPPPAMHPVMPTLYQPPSQPSIATPPSTSSTSKAAATPVAVINQPQSFVVSMNAPGQYPVFTASSGSYPTAPYYPYPGYVQPVAPYHAPTQALPQAQTARTQLQSSGSATSPTTIVSTSLVGVAGTQGPWSDNETERLKKLAEENKRAGQTGDALWDAIVQQWGGSRTRHQILIKATQLGLKETSSRSVKDGTSRGVKRRRGTEDPGSPSLPPAPATSTLPQSTSSPHSQPASTPAASPSLHNRQRPSTSVTPAPTTAANLPWPMPTVAANTPSPVISTASTSQDQRATSYYRPRPTESSSKPISGPNHPIGHTYISYQPNGTTTGSRLNQNGR